MAGPDVMLRGFVYGEHLEGVPPRSLGYRLLLPAQPEPWAAEVEALARKLQAAPYPDAWPPTDLFCSVLLEHGQRLVAVARYGLLDHTPGRRRGGLELLGVIGPADLPAARALAVSRWLRGRRQATDDPRTLAGDTPLSVAAPADAPEARDTPAAAAPGAVPGAAPGAVPGAVPVLPVRAWQDGALLFAASAPSEPDQRLRLLEQEPGRAWQWLPLVGADFPLAAWARRGPVVAWTPHLAGVALQVDRPADREPSRASGSRGWVAAALAGLGMALLAGNLAAFLALRRQVQEVASVAAGTARQPAPRQLPEAPARAEPARDPRDRTLQVLHDLLQERIGPREWQQSRPLYLAKYEQIARQHPDLQVPEEDTRARLALGAVAVLAARNGDSVADLVGKALANRGYDPSLVELARQRVRQEMAEPSGSP